MAGLTELDCFPIIMPVTGDISTAEDIDEWWNWLKCFERHAVAVSYTHLTLPTNREV